MDFDPEEIKELIESLLKLAIGHVFFYILSGFQKY